MFGGQPFATTAKSSLIRNGDWQHTIAGFPPKEGMAPLANWATVSQFHSNVRGVVNPRAAAVRTKRFSARKRHKPGSRIKLVAALIAPVGGNSAGMAAFALIRQDVSVIVDTGLRRDCERATGFELGVDV